MDGDSDGVTDFVEKHYKILKEEDIKLLQDKEISSVCEVLSVSRGCATTLLCRYNWMVNAVYENCFSEEAVGKSQHESKSEKLLCKICLEKIKKRKKTMLSCSCGHLFCCDCWKTYVTTSINDGPGCLTLVCPEPNCKTFVGSDMIESLVFGDDILKFYSYLNRSYVESSRNRKWCPAPGCEYAVELDLSNCDVYDVTCDCSYKFCWQCVEESHRPVDCKTVANWIEKNGSESENTNYIIVYTKPCPKCGKPIEKNQGCNHMTCWQPCGYEFCWICLGNWKHHNSNYRCNMYKEENNVSEIEKNREKARMYLEKYIHYFERWDMNDKSWKRAMNDRHGVIPLQVDTIVRVHGETQAQVQFVIDAWEQIIECRRILKWTYAYAYYLEPEKMQFFGYLQGEAESNLERLHYCAEKEMGQYTEAKSGKNFRDFRTKLVDLTKITKTYFENLVRALENKLSEVENLATE